MYIRDTIAAIATPVGAGGIGIIRISGSESISIARKVFSGAKGGDFESHRLYYGRIKHPSKGLLIDEGMLVVMKSPRSYTREDVVELHVHGGYQILKMVLESCVIAGARLAEKGEFTRRAFLNGRIDLCQAEAVCDLVNCNTEASLSMIYGQREGVLSEKIEEIRQFLIGILAIIEAYIDFPEEDIDPSSLKLVSVKRDEAAAIVKKLIASFDVGKVLSRGVSVLFIGKPNVGKSSLLNALACEDRAIVSHIPGTTRDLIEEAININGLLVRIIDAAGIRSECHDVLEKEGIKRTINRLESSDLVFFLVDGSVPVDEDYNDIINIIGEKPYFVILTKSDLPCLVDRNLFQFASRVIEISAHKNFNIDKLRTELYRYVIKSDIESGSNSAMLSNIRHRDLLIRVDTLLSDFEVSLSKNKMPELLAADIRFALDLLGEITGDTTPDDVLDIIFSSFCIGK